MSAGDREQAPLAHALLPFAAGMLIGGLVAAYGGVPAAAAALVPVLAAAVAGSVWRRERLRLLALAAACGVGAAAASAVSEQAPLPAAHLARQVGRLPVRVEGLVRASDPRAGGRALLVQAERAGRGPAVQAATGLVSVTIAHPRRVWQVGARVRLAGRLRRPRNFGNPGGYDQERALARRGILVTMFLWDDAAVTLLAPPERGPRRLLAEVREAAEARLGRIADERVRGYLQAVLLGIDGAVGRDTRALLARTGLAHVVSVSGFHVAVVAASSVLIVGVLLRRSERALVAGSAGRIAVASGLVPVLLYAGIAGGSTPAVRSVLMYAAVLAACLLDRPTDGLRSLGCAAVVMAIGVPDIAADISFELSFVSVAALVVAARRLGLTGTDARSEGGSLGGAPGAAQARAPDASAGGDEGGGRRGVHRDPTRRGARGDGTRWAAEQGAKGRGASQGPTRWGTQRGATAHRLARQLVLVPLYVSAAASLATAPLTAWHFQQVSLIAPVANLLALPLLGPATLLPGLAALPLLALAPSVADLLLAAAALAADLGLRLAAVLARLPCAALATPMPSLLELALCYGLLGLVLGPADGAACRRAGGPGTPPGRRRRVLALAVALASAADVAYWVWERCANPALRVTFLAVGQGDAAVVELPRGGVMVVDGGGMPGGFDTGERVLAPFLRARKIRRVDILVLSHAQLDHYGGLAYLAEQFRPREFWFNGTGSGGAGFARLERALEAAGTRRVVVGRSTPRRTLGAVAVEVLHPGSTRDRTPNDAALVLRLTHGTTALLFTGDVSAEAEAEMLAAGAPLASTVLKVAHHGSASSTTPAFLAAVAPRVAVISAGADNRFGFPAAVVLARLAAVGAATWRTDRDGAVRVRSDGRTLDVRAPCRRRSMAARGLNSLNPFGSC